MTRSRTIESIKKSCNKKGYTYLSEAERLGNHRRINILCACGREVIIKVNNLDKSKGYCKACRADAVRKKDAENNLSSWGYTLNEKYVNRNAPLNATCSAGHIVRDSYNAIEYRGGKCMVCNPYSSRKLDPEYVRLQYKLLGYDLLDTYVRAIDEMSAKCPNGHDFRSNWNAFSSDKKPKRCPCQRPEGFRKGFKDGWPANLYFAEIHFDQRVSWKIGITNNAVKHRLSGVGHKKRILFEVQHRSGLVIRIAEKFILEKFSELKDKKMWRTVDGHSEYFSEPVISSVEELNYYIDQASLAIGIR